MRDFACPNCGQRLAFENSLCLGCNNPIGFDLVLREFAILRSDGVTTAAPARRMCANLNVAGCNWLVPADVRGLLCRSCSLTRTRPADGDPALPTYAEAEAAKRRLVVELIELGLPINDRVADPDRGLTFDLLSSQHEPVITGHDEGVITLDLAEGDDVHRESLRISMDEPYRTLLGHFRHETGHYFFFVLAETGPARAEFESLFGDPDLDYQAAIDRHYSQGAPAGWEDTYVSSYATMHPAEDWAETFAHYLHIRDTLDTASAFGFAPSGATATHPLAGDAGFDRMIELWLPGVVAEHDQPVDGSPGSLPIRAAAAGAEQDAAGTQAGGRQRRGRRGQRRRRLTCTRSDDAHVRLSGPLVTPASDEVV